MFGNDDGDEEEDEDMDLEKDIFPLAPVARPKLPSKQQPWTIDELMKSDDRTDSILFLRTLDDFMAAISNQYKCLAQQCRHDRKSTEIVEWLL
mmetsp:Transcript_3246/g.6070  ORF Transcript_3246/g.6070 Transcript_3246/m.6070 type:complete len:93 (+) Transcript_3246:670-948(+)